MDWDTVKLSDISQIISGGTPKSGTADFWDGDVKWITPKDMGQMTGIYVSETSRKISQLGLEKSSAKLIPENSVILSTRAPIGHLAINTKPMATNQGCRGLVPRENLNSKFLYYFLLSNVEYLNQLGSGATFKELSKGALEKVEVPLPLIPEQKRIVAILDKAFAAIDEAKAKTEQNLKNARELFDSYLQEVFNQRGEGWDERLISELGLVQTGSTPKTSDKENFGDAIPFIKPGHFLEDGTVNTSAEGLSEKGKLSSRIIPKNSVLMVCIGATIGKCGITDVDVTSNQQINSLTPQEYVNHKFIYYQMLTPGFQSKVLELSGQATLPIINKKKWSSLKIFFPTIQEQLNIVDSLNQLKNDISCLTVIYERKLKLISELKKSLLQKAFSGELTANAIDEVMS